MFIFLFLLNKEGKDSLASEENGVKLCWFISQGQSFLYLKLGQGMKSWRAGYSGSFGPYSAAWVLKAQVFSWADKSKNDCIVA